MRGASRCQHERGVARSSPKKLLPPSLPTSVFDPFGDEPQQPSSPLGPLRGSPSRRRGSPSRRRGSPSRQRGSDVPMPLNADEHRAPTIMPGGEMMLTLQQDMIR